MIFLISNPTIDFIEKNGGEYKKRIGGPPFYVSLYSHLCKDVIVSMGGLDYRDLPVFKNLLSKPNFAPFFSNTGCTQKHYLLYASMNNRIVFTPHRCPLPKKDLITKLLGSNKNINTAVYNPTTIKSTEDLWILDYLSVKEETIVSADLQFIVRAPEFLHILLQIAGKRGFDVIHIDLGELTNLASHIRLQPLKLIEKIKNKIALISNGGDPLLLLGKREKYRVTPPFIFKNGESTGAGDILLFYFSLFFGSGEDLIEAARKAVALASTHVGILNELISSYEGASVFSDAIEKTLVERI
jgi:sugar/nucleoside kinase (ribokinase family)